jgi:hypothetical protein
MNRCVWLALATKGLRLGDSPAGARARSPRAVRRGSQLEPIVRTTLIGCIVGLGDCNEAGRVAAFEVSPGGGE